MTMTIGFGLFLFGFYLCFNTSKRAELLKDSVSKYIQKHPKAAKPIGIIMSIISLILLIQSFGFGAGVFVAMVQIMTVASLVVILLPIFKPRKIAQ